MCFSECLSLTIKSLLHSGKEKSKISDYSYSSKLRNIIRDWFVKRKYLLLQIYFSPDKESYIKFNKSISYTDICNIFYYPRLHL